MRIKTLSCFVVLFVSVMSCYADEYDDWSAASDVCMSPIKKRLEEVKKSENDSFVGRTAFTLLKLVLARLAPEPYRKDFLNILEQPGMKDIQVNIDEKTKDYTADCLAKLGANWTLTLREEFFRRTAKSIVRTISSACVMDVKFAGLSSDSNAFVLTGKIVKDKDGRFEKISGDGFRVARDDGVGDQNISLTDAVILNGNRCGLIAGLTPVVLFAQPEGSSEWYVTSGMKFIDGFPKDPDGEFEFRFQKASIGLNAYGDRNPRWTFMAVILDRVTADSLDTTKPLRRKEMLALGYRPDVKSVTLIDKTEVIR